MTPFQKLYHIAFIIGVGAAIYYGRPPAPVQPHLSFTPQLRQPYFPPTDDDLPDDDNLPGPGEMAEQAQKEDGK